MPGNVRYNLCSETDLEAFLEAEEDGGEGPVDEHLGAVEREGGLGGALEAAAVPVDEVGGVAHGAVEVGPHNGKGDPRRVEPGLLQFLQGQRRSLLVTSVEKVTIVFLRAGVITLCYCKVYDALELLHMV